MEGPTENEILLKVFSAEVWRLILECYDHVETYESICKASPFLKCFPTPNKVKVKSLFPKIVPLLRGLIERSYWNSNPTNVLKLRQVCRDWKRGVDSMLQNHPDASMHGNGNKNLEDKFRTLNDLQKFKQNFDTTHYRNGVNPFVSRTVSFQPSRNFRALSTDPVKAFLDASIYFLSKYGSYIWHFSFWFRADDRDIDDYSNWLRRALRTMPNLKSLCTANGCLVQVRDYNLRSPENEPMITLNHLRSIKINHGFSVIRNALIRVNPQITVLNSVIDSLEDAEMLKYRLPNLSELQIGVMSTDLEIVQSQLQIWKNSLYVWPLTKLRLSLRVLLSWQNLFDVLHHKFAETLIELRISLRSNQRMKNSCRLLLPRLKVLELSSLAYTTVDFVLPMKQNLEKLTVVSRNVAISCGDRMELDSRNVIKFNDVFENMHCSSMWEMFPNLKLIQNVDIHTKNKWSCSRHEWINYRKNRTTPS